MVNPSRIKGTAFESAVVDYLHTQGAPHAERRALNGRGDRGDIAGTPDMVWECKATKAIDLAGFIAELHTEMANDGARHGAVIIKRRQHPVRRAYAVMQLDQLCDLLRLAGLMKAGE